MPETYHYQWLYLRTGDSGVKTEEFLSRMAFLESINSWNRIGFGVWQYSEVSNG